MQKLKQTFCSFYPFLLQPTQRPPREKTVHTSSLLSLISVQKMEYLKVCIILNMRIISACDYLNQWCKYSMRNKGKETNAILF